MSTHNICFCGELKKNIFLIAIGDNMHEMENPVSWEKWKKKKKF